MEEFPKLITGVIGTARLSCKTSLKKLVQDYDTQPHEPNISERDNIFAVLALLHLLPSSNTRQKAKLSATEFENCLVKFNSVQVNVAEIVTAKQASPFKQPSLLCVGDHDQGGTFYLILDGKAANLGECGIVRVLDALFKCHYVFWVDYYKTLSLFMEFLQKIMYKLESSKLTPRVHEVHSSITTLIVTN